MGAVFRRHTWEQSNPRTCFNEIERSLITTHARRAAHLLVVLHHVTSVGSVGLGAGGDRTVGAVVGVVVSAEVAATADDLRLGRVVAHEADARARAGGRHLHHRVANGRRAPSSLGRLVENLGVRARGGVRVLHLVARHSTRGDDSGNVPRRPGSLHHVSVEHKCLFLVAAPSTTAGNAIPSTSVIKKI